MFVSVVIPVFNRAELLERAIQSVQRQTYKNFELCIVDDHSTEVIPSHCKSEGKGVSAARNTGVRKTKSDLVAFLDSDDEWEPTKLEKQVRFLTENPPLPMVYTGETWIRKGQRVSQNSKQQKFGGRIFSACTELCFIAPSSVLIRRNYFEDIGMFDESFPVCEDFDLWLRISSDSEIGFLPEALTIKHGGHADQLSRQFHSMDLWRVRALKKHLGNQKLDANEQASLRKALKSKCEILLKGFEKHQNYEYETEVQTLYRTLTNSLF